MSTGAHVDLNRILRAGFFQGRQAQAPGQNHGHQGRANNPANGHRSPPDVGNTTMSTRRPINWRWACGMGGNWS